MSRYDDPGRNPCRRGRYRAERRPADRDPDGRQYRRSADPGRLALSFLRDQRGAALRPRQGAGVPTRHPGRHRHPLRAGAEPRGAAGRLWRRGPGRRLLRAGQPGTLMANTVGRGAYAAVVGPTAGGRARLADTELIIEIESDRTIYGEEVKFGGGKVIRDGMGQSQVTRAGGAVDTVITNAVILDHWGIVKADIGLKDGRVAGIGKAGNPDVQPGIDIIIGPGTEIIAGEGKIVTAGGIDSHIPMICPQQAQDSLYSGVTTMLGGGTGTAAGTAATTCTPGAWHLARVIQAAEGIPVNLGFFGKGNASDPAALVGMVEAGACGLKLHEDWGTTPA